MYRDGCGSTASQKVPGCLAVLLLLSHQLVSYQQGGQRLRHHPRLNVLDDLLLCWIQKWRG
jgi:hypothetical protein